MWKGEAADRVVCMQLFDDASPHGDVVVGPVEAHVVDVADQPTTLRNADPRCRQHHQPPSDLHKHHINHNQTLLTLTFRSLSETFVERSCSILLPVLAKQGVYCSSLHQNTLSHGIHATRASISCR